MTAGRARLWLGAPGIGLDVVRFVNCDRALDALTDRLRRYAEREYRAATPAGGGVDAG